MIDLDELRDAGEKEHIDLFTLDGHTYTIPAKPSASITLRYLKNLRTQGENHAAGVLLEDLLGEDGYNALMNYEDLTMEQLQHVLAAAQKHMLGAIEESGKGE